jgi:hypothetical protein
LDAIQSIGKPAAPYLAEVFLKDETWMSAQYGRLYERLPWRVRQEFPSPYKFLCRHTAASFALARLGSNAVDVLPLITQRTNAPWHYSSIDILKACAPGTTFESNAVEILIDRTKPSEFNSQELAYASLGFFPNCADRTVPTLIKGLNQAQLFRVCVESIQRLGEPAVIALAEAAKKERDGKSSALRALEKIDPEAAAKVRVERLALEKERSVP